MVLARRTARCQAPVTSAMRRAISSLARARSSLVVSKDPLALSISALQAGEQSLFPACAGATLICISLRRRGILWSTPLPGQLRVEARRERLGPDVDAGEQDKPCAPFCVLKLINRGLMWMVE